MEHSTEEILRTEQLAFEYQSGRPVLQKLSLSIYQGEKIAVMGSNGAGQSTFFLNLNGVLWPKEGKIVYRESKSGKKI